MPSLGATAMPMLVSTITAWPIEVDTARASASQILRARMAVSHRLLDAGLDDRELVAADARHRIDLAQAAAQPVGDGP